MKLNICIARQHLQCCTTYKIANSAFHRHRRQPKIWRKCTVLEAADNSMVFQESRRDLQKPYLHAPLHWPTGTEKAGQLRIWHQIPREAAAHQCWKANSVQLSAVGSCFLDQQAPCEVGSGSIYPNGVNHCGA